MTHTIHQGNNIDILKTFEDNSIDSIVTDPPYGIDFLGKDWDANTGALETYQECLRVLKPGGYILAFSAARTYHHLAIRLEQAGFEIRDQLMWLYSSGFPKAQDIGKAIQKRIGVEETKPQKGMNAYNNKGKTAPKVAYEGEDAEYSNKKDEIIPTSPEAKQWAGWKTALKPAHEPIAMARKPMKGSCIDNVLTHGVGALNIDACRLDSETLTYPANGMNRLEFDQGRFPSNVIGEVAEGYQKYFYCPKVSRKERHIGHTMPPALFGDKQGAYDDDGQRYAVKLDSRGVVTESNMLEDMGGYYIDENGNESKIAGKQIWLPQTGNIYIHGLKEEYRKWCLANGKTPNIGNNHPTVKPVELMKWLVKLVTPKGGTVLDPFTGSGSTGMAAVELGYDFIGCELDPAYVDIANKRISAWTTPNNNFEELFDAT